MIAAVAIVAAASLGSTDIRGDARTLEILATAKASYGGAAVDRLGVYSVSERVVQGGIAGTGSETRDPMSGRYVLESSLGPSSSSNCFDGKRVTEGDASGDVWPVGDVADILANRNEAFRTSFGYWYPGRFAPGARWTVDFAGSRNGTRGLDDVVRIRSFNGMPFEIWFDRKGHLIDKIVESVGRATQTTSYSDYRTVSGVAFPFHQNIDDGQGDSTTVDVNSVAPSPAGHVVFDRHCRSVMPDDHAIDGNATSTAIPFELLNNHIFVQTRINGRGPFRFYLDSGGLNLLDSETAARLGVKLAGAQQIGGVGNDALGAGLATIDSVRVGGATMKRQAFIVVPISRALTAVEGVHIDGIVGFELFRRFVATIDYEHRRVTFTNPADYAQPKNATAVPFVYHDRDPQVSGMIDGLSGQFTIDTGSRSSLTLATRFVERNHLRDRYKPTVSGITGFGVGGAATSQLARASKFAMGAVALPSPVIELSVQHRGSNADPYLAGNIGGGAFKRFTMTLNYQRQTIDFVKNSAWPKRDTYDRSGLVLLGEGGAFKIIDVLTGTPAIAAAIKPGNIIIAVDGKPSTRWTLYDLRALLRNAPGTRVRLTLDTRKGARTVVLVLKDYV